MKRILLVTLLLALALLTVSVALPREGETADCLRIHIRANSNSTADQDVKYLVKGEVVKLLSPLLEHASSTAEAKNIVASNMDNIENVANKVLKEGGMPYVAHAVMRREHFPIRHYGNVTLAEGDYDALILELGEAVGDNWWCVAFPPLCFVPSEEAGTGDFHYVSKIAEIIAKKSRK